MLRKPKVTDYSFILTEVGAASSQNPIIYTKSR